MGKFKDFLRAITNISEDVDVEAANQAIRKNITFRGHNVYILAFAIIIASIGLNINSIPVIIGAMLISPLMGPIIGFGLGLGTNDTKLIKSSLINLTVMMAISILSSAIYFALSPLKMENPTELLARTRPTIYDVLIALFGGFAGIFEMSRKDRSGGTVISGVAIATALMPPLCTVGYGLATFRLKYALGAFYLFSINSIFIALATYVTVKFLKFPQVVFKDRQKERKLKRNIAIITILIMIPSIFTAVMVVKENNFNTLASKFVKENKSIGKGYIYDYKTNATSRPPTIEISMAGEILSDSDKEHLFEAAEDLGLTRKQLIIKENASFKRENYMSGNELVEGIFRRNEAEIKKRESTIMDMEKQLDEYKSRDIPYSQISKEITAQYPGIDEISIARGAQVKTSTFEPDEEILVNIKWVKPASADELSKIESYLKVRLNFENVKIISQQEP